MGNNNFPKENSSQNQNNPKQFANYNTSMYCSSYSFILSIFLLES